MRRILYSLFVVLLVFAGCKSSEKLLQKGEYEEAVQIAVKRLQKNPSNDRQARILKEAYPRAVQEINDRIAYLKREGNPASWDEIYTLYLKLDNMQKQVETVTPLQVGGTTVYFEHKNYDAQIIEAKNRAAEYHYAMAKKLMSQGDKLAYRKAYDHLMKIKKYGVYYPDLEDLIKTCIDRGTTYVLIVPVNKTIYRLPPDFMYDLVNFPVDRLNSLWVSYNTNDVRDGDYDLIIYVVLKNAQISANEQKEENFTLKRKVKTGYRTERDTNGNYYTVPDSAVVSCKVKRVVQRKVAHISGELQYFDNHTKQVVKIVPIAADHVFENVFAVWSGDKRACTDRVLKEAKNRVVAFPNDLDMILAASETLKDVIWQAIRDNRGFVNRRY